MIDNGITLSQDIICSTIIYFFQDLTHSYPSMVVSPPPVAIYAAFRDNAIMYENGLFREYGELRYSLGNDRRAERTVKI
ncbi:hypothetical protein [Desulfocicer vacuolatum]|uniref:hypothetical protein n=1 Tax=Desulfocicer vacuolatum TaxID=2298 RepID=UPI00111C7A05|nr:hypothetical protein [Desulfocicer vacuolatum]